MAPGAVLEAAGRRWRPDGAPERRTGLTMRNPSLALLAPLLAACAATPVEVAAPDVTTVAAASTRDQALQVAGAADGTGYRVAVTVDARVARTHVGRLHAGDRLRV